MSILPGRWLGGCQGGWLGGLGRDGGSCNTCWVFWGGKTVKTLPKMRDWVIQTHDHCPAPSCCRIEGATKTCAGMLTRIVRCVTVTFHVG